jgi:hypothetical protein
MKEIEKGKRIIILNFNKSAFQLFAASFAFREQFSW